MNGRCLSLGPSLGLCHMAALVLSSRGDCCRAGLTSSCQRCGHWAAPAAGPGQGQPGGQPLSRAGVWPQGCWQHGLGGGSRDTRDPGALLTAPPPRRCAPAVPALVNVKARQTSTTAAAPPAPPLGAASSRAVFPPGAGSARPVWLKKAIGLAGTAGQQIPSPSSLLATLAHSMHLSRGVPGVHHPRRRRSSSLSSSPPSSSSSPLGAGEVKVPGGTVAVVLVLLDPAAESRANHQQGRRLPCRVRLCLHVPSPAVPPPFHTGFCSRVWSQFCERFYSWV